MMDSDEAMGAPRGVKVDLSRTVAPRVLVMLALALLAVEFLFGMAANLWPTPTLPSSLAPLFGPSAASYGYLSAHVIVGVLLVLVEILLVVFVARIGRRPLIGIAIIGLVLVLLAAFCGSEYLASDQNASYSLLMGAFFLAAWTSGIIVAFRLRMITRLAHWQARHPGPWNPGT